MIDVLCSEMELEEYGEILAVGDRLERLGSSNPGDFYGTGLDAVAWSFDRYAHLSIGRTPAMISGDVVALAAIYVRIRKDADREGAWVPRRGSAWLEPVRSTTDTRRPLRRVVEHESPPDERGRVRVSGRIMLEENDELLTGWRVTLVEEAVVVQERLDEG